MEERGVHELLFDKGGVPTIKYAVRVEDFPNRIFHISSSDYSAAFPRPRGPKSARSDFLRDLARFSESLSGQRTRGQSQPGSASTQLQGSNRPWATQQSRPLAFRRPDHHGSWGKMEGAQQSSARRAGSPARGRTDSESYCFRVETQRLSPSRSPGDWPVQLFRRTCLRQSVHL